MFSRKSQSGLEFVLIFFFIFSIVFILITVLGYYSVDLTKKENKKELDDFANSIQIEAAILQKVTGGFHRKLEIPDHFIKRFNLSITSSYLIIKSNEFGIAGDDEFYYTLPGENVSIEMVKEANNITYLIIYKEFKENFDGLDLSS